MANKSRKNEKGKGFLSIIMGIILALIIATGGFVLVTKLMTNSQTRLANTIDAPDLIGINVDDAREMVENMGLKFEIKDRLVNYSFDLDDIIDQEPNPGTKVKEGAVIRVTVNNLENNVEVLRYIGKSIDEVENQIEEDGLVLGEIEYEEVEDEELVGQILEQDLRPGTRVERSSLISFTVGKERELKLVEMVDLIGVNVEDAKILLEEKGLKYSIKEQEREDFDEGDVIEQGIKPGDEVEEGSVIDLVIAKKPEEIIEPEIIEPEISPDNEAENETGDQNPDIEDQDQEQNIISYTISIDLPQSDQYQSVRIEKIEGSKKTVEYNSLHLSDEGTLVIDVTGDSKAIYQVFVDDVLYKTEP